MPQRQVAVAVPSAVTPDAPSEGRGMLAADILVACMRVESVEIGCSIFDGNSETRCSRCNGKLNL